MRGLDHGLTLATNPVQTPWVLVRFPKSPPVKHPRCATKARGVNGRTTVSEVTDLMDILFGRLRCCVDSSACATVGWNVAGSFSPSLARRRSPPRTGSRSRCCRRSRPTPSRVAGAPVAGVGCSRTSSARRRDTPATRRTQRRPPPPRAWTPPPCSLPPGHPQTITADITKRANPPIHIQGTPLSLKKRLTHCQVSPLNRIKNRHWG